MYYCITIKKNNMRRRVFMTLGPILRAKLAKYIQDYELTDIKEDEAFELFVNYHILSQQQPGIFSTDSGLIKDIGVGGGNDLGIDGIAISLNGRLIGTKEEIDDILSVYKKGKFHFTFIQSKNREKFELGEFSKYTAGVLDFLNENIVAPINDDIKRWHEIYNYIMSDDIIIKWDCPPSIDFVYVTLGTWEGNEHILGNAKNTKEILLKKCCFDEIMFRYVDAKVLTGIVNGNENCYSTVLEVVDSMPLPQVDKVDSSSVIMCSARELLKLLSDDGVLRRNLFEDNVRDYQGDTTINQEIRHTLECSTQEFVLLNNGITIVCDEMHEGNRKVSLKNPQVVNGCQTCNVIFKCSLDQVDLSNAFVIIKVIASDDTSIVNSIVKGTNRQNIVYDEAFEVTKDFHKLLEAFFKEMQVGNYEKIYYERRSKQYEGEAYVKPYQKANFRVMIQSFVSLFLYKAEEGHHHESRLLQDYSKSIFSEYQSFAPYYIAAFIYLHVERLFKKKVVSKKYSTYKWQIMLLLKEMLGGASGDINHKKEIEKYCARLIDIIAQKDSLEKDLIIACERFDTICAKWVELKGESYRFHIKDNYEFTKFMIATLGESDTRLEDVALPINKGRVITVKTDKHGAFFGFITHLPENIFFHESMNSKMDLSYIGKEVFFDIINENGKAYGVNVRII